MSARGLYGVRCRQKRSFITSFVCTVQTTPSPLIPFEPSATLHALLSSTQSPANHLISSPLRRQPPTPSATISKSKTLKNKQSSSYRLQTFSPPLLLQMFADVNMATVLQIAVRNHARMKQNTCSRISTFSVISASVREIPPASWRYHMGRDSFDCSESPVRNHRSSHRSPSRRERSPARHRSSYSTKSPPRDKPSSRTKSPKRPKSPISHSPPRDKPSRHTKSSKHTRSRSPSDRLPVKEPPLRSPGSRSPSPRSKRLRGARSNQNDKSSERVLEKNHRKTRSPESRSPSPRTRRLMRAQADVGDKISDKGTRKEKDHEIERRHRTSGRDADDSGSYKSRQVEHHRTRHRSSSPPRDEGNDSREDHRNGDDDSVARMKAAAEALETKEKQKPSFELSGKLAAETNRVKGVTLLFTEPPDARKPDIRWRLYVFKGGEVLNEPLYVHRQTCYLFGRERRVADIPTDHPSCSKQHAVLQYRQVEKEQPDGMLKKEVRPYIMDLGSTNGTFLNDNRIEPERYYELMEKDTIKFGNSSREYVILHENSAG
ncbi:hypothetical protein QVD17_01513 [Tagetes erecta]|uniref:FHA domain-containing protein n=1 Tax=Tagetes erecta TaxID=13708 RepID=A0AAD8L7M9_TARER|nr:hypothetical protein QVD17_01513 [Tagetes erecta]